MSSTVLQSIKWLFIERGGQIFIALILNAILARHLGVESFGRLQAALSAIAIFSSAALVCGAELILPIYGEDQKKYKNIFSEVFVFRSIFQGLAFIACIFFILNNQEGNLFLYFVLAVMVLLVEPANAFSIYFQFWGQQKIISTLKLMAVTMKLLIVIAFIYFNVSLEKFGIAYLFEAALVSFGLIIAYRSKGFLIAKRPTEFLKKQIFTKGILFGVGIFFMIFFQNIDKLALNYFNMHHELGLYSAAVQIAANWYGIANMLLQSVGGRLIYSKSVNEANQSIIKMALSSLLISAAAAFLVYVFGDFFMKFFFGLAFAKSAEYLFWMIAISSLTFIDAIFSMKMIKSKSALTFTLKWCIASIIVFIYTYGSEYYDYQYNPIFGLVLGYGLVAIFSLIYFCIEIRHEKNINNM